MKKTQKWTNPVKNRAPKESTLDIKGDFGKFTELMRRIIRPTPSASRVPADASNAEHQNG